MLEMGTIRSRNIESVKCPTNFAVILYPPNSAFLIRQCKASPSSRAFISVHKAPQVYIAKSIHALDCHPGNVFLTEDHRIALFDLGMVGHVTPQLQENLLQLLLAVSDGRGDDAAGLAIKISELKEFFAENSF